MFPVSPVPTKPASSPSLDQHRWFADEVHVHDGQLKAYLRGAFPAVHDVEDVVQESYLRVWKARAAQPILCAKAFLFRVARNIALDAVKKPRGFPLSSLGDLSELDVLEDKPTVRELVSADEKARLLGEALATLPPRQREIIVLSKIKGLTHRATAEHLGISNKTVDEHVHQALKRLDAEFRRRGIDGYFGA